jgi:hypothetical protein
VSLFPDGHLTGTFIHAPLATVANELLSWRQGLDQTCAAWQVSTPLSAAWSLLEPRAFTPDRAILVACHSEWTAFFDNHEREFASGEPRVLCKRLRTSACVFALDDRPEFAGYHFASFDVYRWLAGEVAHRGVMVHQEGAWKFWEGGEPLPFETLEAYRARRKRDRLSEDILRSYGQHLGIRFWDPAFYRTEVVALAWHNVSGQPIDETARQLVATAKECGIHAKVLARK